MRGSSKFTVLSGAASSPHKADASKTPVVNEEIEAQAGHRASLRSISKSQVRVQGHSFLSRNSVISSESGGSKASKSCPASQLPLPQNETSQGVLQKLGHRHAGGLRRELVGLVWARL